MADKPTKSEDICIFGNQKYAGKARFISWILLAIGVILIPVCINNEVTSHNIFIILIPLTLILVFSSLASLLFIFNKKFYNNVIYLIVFVIIGFIFKRNHWFGAGIILIISFGTAATGFWFISMMSLSTFKQNRFLRLFGFFMNIILSFSFVGGLLKTQHWPFGGFFISTGSLFFLMAVLSLVFTLPNANYIEWSSFAKKFFYRAILVPMIFIFITSTLTFVFPETWNNLFTGFVGGEPWHMDGIEYFPKEGL